jgi:hypothetical protein
MPPFRLVIFFHSSIVILYLTQRLCALFCAVGGYFLFAMTTGFATHPVLAEEEALLVVGLHRPLAHPAQQGREDRAVQQGAAGLGVVKGKALRQCLKNQPNPLLMH